MKQAKFFWLSGLAVMAGVLAAAIVAPSLYVERSDPGARRVLPTACCDALVIMPR